MSRLNKTCSSACSLCLSALILLLTLAATPSVAKAESDELSSEGLQILSLLNGHRSGAGLGLLSVNSLLNQAAQAHANDILYNHNYSHYGTDGTLAANRVARTGYSDTPWVSENWVTSRSPEAAMQWWMNDYIHRVNILTPRWQEVGIGAAISSESGEMVFVTVFSAGRDARGEYVAGTVERVATAASAVVVNVPAEGLNYAVRAGDTLMAIGMRHGVDFEQIATANGFTETSLLQIGQMLHIPGSGDAVAQSGEPSMGVGGPVQIETVDYHISPGDTLVSIAMKTSTTWRELAAINGLGEFSLLQIGDTIQVPAPEVPEEMLADVTVPSEPAAEPEPDAVAATGGTIGSDAGNNGNNGDDIVVAASLQSSSQENSNPQQREYVVQSGDTLIGIAVKFDVDLSKLMLMNGLGEDSLLQLGQHIVLP